MDYQEDRLAPLKKVFVAATPNDLVNTPTAQGSVAGFWQGLWHGFIFPFAFFLSLFNKKIGLYEVHNNGGWYHFGFFLGLSMSLGGSKVNVAVNKKK
jgi:hypothetical protein